MLNQTIAILYWLWLDTIFNHSLYAADWTGLDWLTQWSWQCFKSRKISRRWLIQTHTKNSKQLYKSINRSSIYSLLLFSTVIFSLLVGVLVSCVSLVVSDVVAGTSGTVVAVGVVTTLLVVLVLAVTSNEALCFNTWRLRWSERENALSQNLHRKGFSPVCRL